MRPLMIGLCLLLITLTVLRAGPSAAAEDLDFDVAGGHFFKQTNGRDGAGTTGYAVLDDEQAKFWTEFNRLGGLQVIGYPISQRFSWHGFTVQAFQKVVLQWRPEVEQAYFVNVFDQLALSGLDPWLEAFRQVPPSFDTVPDAGLAWEAVVARHLAFLDANAAIKARYFADADPVPHFGLPMSYHDYGNVFVVRTQRVVFQQWRFDVPWAHAGQVVIANGGAIAVEAGLLPPSALTPHEPPTSSELPATVEAVRQLAIHELAVTDPVDVRVALWERVDWPDSCLGLAVRGTACAQVITPGYRVLLEVRGRGLFEYRSDVAGLLMLPAGAPATGIESPALAL